jgi:hypothetical protein
MNVGDATDVSEVHAAQGRPWVVCTFKTLVTSPISTRCNNLKTELTTIINHSESLKSVKMDSFNGGNFMRVPALSMAVRNRFICDVVKLKGAHFNKVTCFTRVCVSCGKPLGVGTGRLAQPNGLQRFLWLWPSPSSGGNMFFDWSCVPGPSTRTLQQHGGGLSADARTFCAGEH